jgi:hypothetical protein
VGVGVNVGGAVALGVTLGASVAAARAEAVGGGEALGGGLGVAAGAVALGAAQAAISSARPSAGNQRRVFTPIILPPAGESRLRANEKTESETKPPVCHADQWQDLPGFDLKPRWLFHQNLAGLSVGGHELRVRSMLFNGETCQVLT